MDILFKSFLAAHIAGGTTALLAGCAAMIAPKGNHIHALMGKTYYWSMAVVCASAVVMSLLHPQQFLFYVAIFSFYLVFTGERLTKRKSADAKAEQQDWIAALLAVLGGSLLLVRGVWLVTHGEQFGWVAMVFGAICLSISLRDMHSFLTDGTEQSAWLFKHLSRMVGSYIAAVTAFCVVNLTFLPVLLVWLLPTLVGTLGISAWTAYYRRRLG
jgi:uncharacterized membrane protein